MTKPTHGGGGPPGESHAKTFARFRDDYARMLRSSDLSTGDMVARLGKILAGEYASISEDAKLWLIMEHGLDIDRWERRRHARGDAS